MLSRPFSFLDKPVNLNFYYFVTGNNNYSWKSLNKNYQLKQKFLIWINEFSKCDSLAQAKRIHHYKIESIPKALKIVNIIKGFENFKKVEYYYLDGLIRLYGIFKSNVFYVILLDIQKRIQK